MVAEVAAVQQHYLQKEASESEQAVERTLTAQQQIRDKCVLCGGRSEGCRLRKTQVDSALLSQQLKGHIGKKVPLASCCLAACSPNACCVAACPGLLNLHLLCPLSL